MNLSRIIQPLSRGGGIQTLDCSGFARIGSYSWPETKFHGNTNMINEAHQVIDSLFESCCKRMKSMPTDKLQDLTHEAQAESSIAESQIRKTAAMFVYRCAEAVLNVQAAENYHAEDELPLVEKSVAPPPRRKP